VEKGREKRYRVPLFQAGPLPSEDIKRIASFLGELKICGPQYLFARFLVFSLQGFLQFHNHGDQLVAREGDVLISDLIWIAQRPFVSLLP